MARGEYQVGEEVGRGGGEDLEVLEIDGERRDRGVQGSDTSCCASGGSMAVKSWAVLVVELLELIYVRFKVSWCRRCWAQASAGADAHLNDKQSTVSILKARDHDIFRARIRQWRNCQPTRLARLLCSHIEPYIS